MDIFANNFSSLSLLNFYLLAVIFIIKITLNSCIHKTRSEVNYWKSCYNNNREVDCMRRVIILDQEPLEP